MLPAVRRLRAAVRSAIPALKSQSNNTSSPDCDKSGSSPSSNPSASAAAPAESPASLANEQRRHRDVQPIQQPRLEERRTVTPPPSTKIRWRPRRAQLLHEIVQIELGGVVHFEHVAGAGECSVPLPITRNVLAIPIAKHGAIPPVGCADRAPPEPAWCLKPIGSSGADCRSRPYEPRRSPRHTAPAADAGEGCSADP